MPAKNMNGLFRFVKSIFINGPPDRNEYYSEIFNGLRRLQSVESINQRVHTSTDSMEIAWNLPESPLHTSLPGSPPAQI